MEFFESLFEFWPIIEAMCRALEIPVTVTLKEIECISFGFDSESIVALYKHERYAGIPRKKIIPMEEYRLIQVTKGLFGTLMVRLDKTFRKSTRADIAQNIAPFQAEWQSVPIVDEPIVPKHKNTVKPAAAKPMEPLNKTDSDILQAMSANPKTTMLKLEIVCASGYGKYAVAKSLKRLEEMRLICKPNNIKRKGWILTERGIAIISQLK